MPRTRGPAGRFVGMPRCAARLLPLVAAALFLSLPAEAAPPGEPEARARPFGVRDPGRARFEVLEVVRLLKAADWERAFPQAQEVLDERSEDLVLVEQTPQSERWRMATTAVREALLALPPEGRARYDAFAALRAAPLRAEALATGRLEPLRTLWRRFATSAVGVEAAEVLVATSVEAGRPRDAAALAREALRTAPDSAPLWLALVAALEDADDGPALAALKPPPGLTVASALGPLALDERLEAARRSRTKAPAARDRAMWGGRPSRDLPFPAEGARATSLRWSAPTQLTLRDRDEPRTWPQGEGDAQVDFAAHLESYRPLFPAADGGLVYASDGRTLRALDLLGGRPAWVFEAGSSPLRLLDRGRSAEGRTALDRPFAPSLWRDLVIATLEVELDPSRPFVPEWLMQAQINTYMPLRTLVGVDRRRGTLRWAVGREPGDRLVLRGVTFVSECVVADDLVFVVGARRTTQHLVSLFAFEAADGRLAWETPLAYGQQETNLFGNPVKEFSAGAVSASDGVVYAQTGLGCLAAVEARGGALRWLASYEIDPIQKVEFWYVPPLRIPRVGPVAPLVLGETLVAAPGDALHINAFDRRTGALLWRVPHGALDTPYHWFGHVLGAAKVRGRDSLVVTGRHVLALDLANGKVVARGRLDPEDANVVGQGAIAGRTVLVPTDEGVQRFSLDGELKLLGRDPWPRDAEPGNLLPLGQVLVVATRDRLQGYYAWEDVEKELLRRRQEHPRDPEVLVEVGEVYLKGGNRAEARKAFEAAQGLAERASPLAERARLGLVALWMAEGVARREKDVAAAAGAFREALQRATLASERVAARLALDEVLPPTSDERVKNLERLCDEAGEERAGDDGGGEPLLVKPVALLRLARVESDAGRPRRAVAALQRVLHEMPDAALGAETAGEVARRRIAALLARSGRDAYAEEEAKAEALLAAAAPGDDAPLERVLADYPNAAAVPRALRALAESRLGAGRSAEAASALRSLLDADPPAEQVPPALALLARAYGLERAFGARKAALAALVERSPSPEARFGLEGRRWTPAEWAAAEVAERPGPAPRPDTATLGLPLTEAAFEPPGDAEAVLPLAVADEPDDPCPLALIQRAGAEVRAIDMAQARVAWRLGEGSAPRAAWAAGTLVLATRGTWRGLDPADAAVRWSTTQQDLVQEVAVAHGAVVAWSQTPVAGRSERRVTARDPATGLVLWSTSLGFEAVYELRAAGSWVTITRARWEDGETRSSLLVLDALTGTLLREIPLAGGRDGRAALLGARLLTAGPDGAGRRSVSAVDLASGAVAWTRRLEGSGAVATLVPDGERVWALQQDGRLTALALADGRVVATTTVSQGTRVGPTPAFGTEARIEDGRLTLLTGATSTRAGPALLQFDLATGRLLWEVEGAPLVRGQAQHLAQVGGRWVVLLVGQDGQQRRRALLRVVEASTGAVEQTLEPRVEPEAGVVGLEAGFGTLVVLTNSGVSVYAGVGGAVPGPTPGPAPGPIPQPLPR